LNPDGSSTVNEEELKQSKGYMETPCAHKFHKKCLVHWMGMKMECPTCRRELPPIQNYDLSSSEDEEEDES